MCHRLEGKPCSHSKALLTKSLDRLELGVPQHQPLTAFAEVHLDPGLGTGAFEVEDHPIAEHRVPHGLAETEASFRDVAAAKQDAVALLLAAAERTAAAVGRTPCRNTAIRHFRYAARPLV